MTTAQRFKPLGTTHFNRLRVLASGGVVVVPGKRDWQPLLRRGWVEDAGWDLVAPGNPPRGCLPPLQITPAGLCALADYVEVNGWPNRVDNKATSGQR